MYDPSKYLYYVNDDDRRDAILFSGQLQEVENSAARGKLARDRCVADWRRAVKAGPDGVALFQAEEFMEAIGYDGAEFLAIFGRHPDWRVLLAWDRMKRGNESGSASGSLVEVEHG